MNVIPFCTPISKQPSRGVRVKLFLKNNKQTYANCCEVISKDGSHIQYINESTKRNIEPKDIFGWLPAQFLVRYQYNNKKGSTVIAKETIHANSHQEAINFLVSEAKRRNIKGFDLILMSA